MSILFCTPCYGGMATLGYMKSAISLTQCIPVEHDFLFGANESLITRARNEMTATFLRSNHTHMMWIDADIEFSPEDVGKLWNLDADIAVGIYPMKRPGAPYAAWVNGKLVNDLDQFTDPIEVDYAGTGFMLLKREAIDALCDLSPLYEGPNGWVHAIYQTPVVDEHFDSEDYHLCRQWRSLGGKILADPSVRLLHHGTYAYGQVLP